MEMMMAHQDGRHYGLLMAASMAEIIQRRAELLTISEQTEKKRRCLWPLLPSVAK